MSECVRRGSRLAPSRWDPPLWRGYVSDGWDLKTLMTVSELVVLLSVADVCLWHKQCNPSLLPRPPLSPSPSYRCPVPPRASPSPQQAPGPSPSHSAHTQRRQWGLLLQGVVGITLALPSDEPSARGCRSWHHKGNALASRGGQDCSRSSRLSPMAAPTISPACATSLCIQQLPSASCPLLPSRKEEAKPLNE